MRGGTVKAIIAELLGRRDGVAFGKGISSVGHVVDDRWFNAHVRERILWREWYRRRSSPGWCWYAFLLHHTAILMNRRCLRNEISEKTCLLFRALW